MLPTDLDHLISVGSPALSPDGQTVAFVVTRVDADANEYRSQIWLAPVAGETPPRPFTSGEHKDAAPAWSPDGTRLAFTSSRGTGEGTKASLQVAPVRVGGEVVTLARLKEGIDTPRWSPDGSAIAFLARLFPEPRTSDALVSHVDFRSGELHDLRDQYNADLIGSTTVQVRDFQPDRLRMKASFSAASAGSMRGCSGSDAGMERGTSLELASRPRRDRALPA